MMVWKLHQGSADEQDRPRDLSEDADVERRRGPLPSGPSAGLWVRFYLLVRLVCVVIVLVTRRYVCLPAVTSHSASRRFRTPHSTSPRRSTATGRNAAGSTRRTAANASVHRRGGGEGRRYAHICSHALLTGHSPNVQALAGLERDVCVHLRLQVPPRLRPECLLHLRRTVTRERSCSRSARQPPVTTTSANGHSPGLVRGDLIQQLQFHAPRERRHRPHGNCAPQGQLSAATSCGDGSGVRRFASAYITHA